ncbi:L,D-transpeptidase family protein [Paenibacillus alkalitolerans]|uniref:L,D-transpeptidase family protein n=1 Tax=Paenibacillus alkalitolerans TaxID=2799335 RepID=UPI0018F5CC76|nr:L,D-transpeptidase family protein [Paenibacillus alkalitolerans]
MLVTVIYRAGIIALSLFVILAGFYSSRTGAKAANDDLIIVNKKTNELTYFKDGMLEKRFSVATGKSDSLTPEGTYKIVNKIKNRPYYKDKIPGGDPRNPLGDRWLGLDARGTRGTTYAIHGNNNPKSIGKYVSLGCIRMHNDEVHWLFDQVEVNTVVIITNSDLSPEEIAENHQYELAVTFDGKISVYGEIKETRKEFILYKERLFVPLRRCFELLGGTVNWDRQSKTVTAVIGDKEIVHIPESNIVIVNGTAMEIEIQSRLLKESVMIPLRDFAEITGYVVHWDGAANTIAIN